jgi:hypothetical protein
MGRISLVLLTKTWSLLADNFVSTGGSCYYFSGPVNKTFEEAYSACKTDTSIIMGLKSDLVSVHSSLDNDFLLSQSRRLHHRHGSMYDLWIGLRDYNDDFHLVWTDQTDVDYTNWHIEEPYEYQTVSF